MYWIHIYIYIYIYTSLSLCIYIYIYIFILIMRAIGPMGPMGSQLDLDLDISSLGFHHISSYKKGG